MIAEIVVYRDRVSQEAMREIDWRFMQGLGLAPACSRKKFNVIMSHVKPCITKCKRPPFWRQLVRWWKIWIW